MTAQGTVDSADFLTVEVVEHGVSRWNRIMGLLVGGMVLAGLCWAPASGWASIPLLLTLTPLVGVAWHLHDVRHHGTRDVLLGVFWACAVNFALGGLLEGAARTPFRLVDRELAAIDGLVFQTGSVVAWVSHHSAVERASAIAYTSLLPLLLTVLVSLPLSRHSRAAYHLVVAGGLATVITTAIFAVLPAAGPWTVEGYQPNRGQAAVASELRDIKARQHVGALQEHRIIAFPSFHTVIAILCAIASWPLRRFRWICLPLCVCICASTITTGWHYGVDVLAGIAVAFLTWKMAGSIL